MYRLLNTCGFPNLASVLGQTKSPIKIGLPKVFFLMVLINGSKQIILICCYQLQKDVKHTKKEKK